MCMIHIITAVYNRKAITEKFVNLLLNQKYKDIHLILVDDGSSDGTAEMVREKMPTCTVIKGNGKLWWGGALHKAYKWVRTNLADKHNDYVMISNDDVYFEENYLEIAMKHLREFPEMLVTGEGYSKNSGKQLDGTFKVDYSKKWDENKYEFSHNRIGDCASTRSIFVSVDNFIKIGGFHPWLLPHYGADYEWTMRAAHKGFSIISFEDLKYYFDENTTGDNFYDKLTIRKVFGKRSVTNPIYKYSFIFLAVPYKYWLSEIHKQNKRLVSKVSLFRKIVNNSRRE